MSNTDLTKAIEEFQADGGTIKKITSEDIHNAEVHHKAFAYESFRGGTQDPFEWDSRPMQSFDLTK